MQNEHVVPPYAFMTVGFFFAAFGCPAYFAQESYDAPLWLGPLLLMGAVAFLSISVISIGVTNGIARAHLVGPVDAPSREASASR
ncbi:MAG: hypothetical protein WB471_12630 [Nocardioides sp.]